ncbi:MAG: beta galactosidase jelly roll domain-containing protein, partial [Lachnospiraceae bacterium]|nr:beta galactosidase jelly roll domain-containing protein [Lachnospiraceae bacterium]
MGKFNSKGKGKRILLAVTGFVTGVLLSGSVMSGIKADSVFESENYKYGTLTKVQGEAVTRTALTGNEWIGKDGNLDITSVNNEADSVNAIPYADMETAYYGAKDYNREGSSYYKLLTGEGEKWDLNVYDNPTLAAEEDDFINDSYVKDSSAGWKEVELPAGWTHYGFDKPIYTNSRMPFEESANFPEVPKSNNPTGLYRKTFTLSDSDFTNAGRVYITFAGVESAYYVYLNGKEVGYSEDSYDQHTFDITDLVNEDGENLLAVKVIK